MNLKHIVLSLSVLLFSCSKEEPSVVDFRVSVDETYFDNAKDGWMVLHDSDGKIVGYQQLELSKSYEFRDLNVSDGKIGVTLILAYEDGSGKTTLNLRSYLSVSTPAEWKLTKSGQSNASCGSSVGNASFSITGTGLGDIFDSSLSSRYTYQYGDEATSSSQKISYAPVAIGSVCDDWFVYTQDATGAPKYKFIENVTSGNYSFSMDQLGSFDKVLKVNLSVPSKVYFYVRSFEEGKSLYGNDGFYTNLALKSVIKNVSVGSFSLGYLNRFQKHITSVSVFPFDNFEDYYVFEQGGGVPSEVVLPMGLVPVITNRSWSGFSYTANESFVYRETTFGSLQGTQSGGQFGWIIHAGPDGSQKNLGQMPEAFSLKYPQFKIENAIHITSAFYKQHPGLTELINENFQGASKPDSYVFSFRVVK